MNSNDRKHTIGVLASGGVDSCVLISQLLRQGRCVQPLYIRSNLVWEAAEVRALQRYLAATETPTLRELVQLELPLADLYGGHWSITGDGIPAGDTPDDAVFLPGRNALLVVKAAVWCQLNAVQELALAPLVTNPFDDGNEQFFQCAEALFRCYDDAPIRIVLPFARLTKREVLLRARDCPLELTFSCIAPVGDRHCGRCNKCVERRHAFRDADLADPTRYASGG